MKNLTVEEACPHCDTANTVRGGKSFYGAITVKELEDMELRCTWCNRKFKLEISVNEIKGKDRNRDTK